jgi:hypothetical protein
MAYAVPPNSEPSIAFFGKSGPENLPTGTTTIGFDTNAPFNTGIVTNTYTLVGDNSTFTIGASGLYQVEANLTVSANGATWALPLKTLNVVLTRNATTATIASSTVNITSTNNYAIHSSMLFPFLTGDTIQIQHVHTITGGTPTALGLQSGFDLNTWVSFQFIKSV